MKVFVLVLVGLVCAFFVDAQGVRRLAAAGAAVRPAAAQSNPLPIRRVILYSNGVAYVERRGFVTGDAQVDLSFKQSQVDDVLKSMVVLDLGNGRIGAVSYNSSAPASARTAEIPFNVSATSESSENEPGGLASVLSQLQGAKVAITSTKGNAIGAILTVEKKPAAIGKDDKKDGPAIPSYSVVVAAEDGEVTSFDLADIRGVKLLEDDVRHDINEFANATASTRRRDAKTISIATQGAGRREIVVSYTIAAPIWKTTYRVVMDDAGKPFFQGWAIVDNVSDDDWNGVQLSLVSGSPVSFIQNLQKPLYRYRPIIPIPDDLNLDPQVYDEGEVRGSGSGSGTGEGYGNGSGGGVAGTINTRQIKDLPANGRSYANNAMVEVTSVSDALVNQQGGIQTAATGSELGDLFEYKIADPVTVTRNRSALIPIVQTTMEGERVSIYNQAARADRPMSGMMLTNTTPLTFEGGSMTILDRDAYAGEALMERLKPKEKRLISFALDLGTRVSVDEVGDDRRPAQLIKVVNGTFQVHYFKDEKHTYHLSNQTEHEKVVYIEHAIRKDWGLSDDTVKPDIVTEKYYRFRVTLKPFEKVDLPVTERQGLMDSYSLGAITPDQVRIFVSRKYIDPALEARLDELIALRAKIAETDKTLAALDEEQERIAADQKRFRENIEALTKTPEAKTLIDRYIAKANDQESRLEAIEKQRQSLLVDKERQQDALGQAIKNFEVK